MRTRHRSVWTVLAGSLLFGGLLATSGLVAAAPASAAHAHHARPSSGELCEPGSYSSTGTTPCFEAPPGTYVPDAGQTSTDLCPAGTYNPISGAATEASCIPAPPGTSAAAGSARAHLVYLRYVQP